MDDRRRSGLRILFFVAITVFALGLVPQVRALEKAPASTEFQLLPPEHLRALERSFTEAQRELAPVLSKQKHWSCDMYGMRTKYQVRRGVPLYDWTPANNAEWTNGGEHPVDRYVLEGQHLIGRDERVRDEVRLTTKGQLVSRLTSVAEPKRVLAYSLCSAN